ncbi:MAG: TonB-dependent receptor plug domain-containing protein, partial [Proteobacteria bacterium]|nr:TonB-dependent receptor plug domain-containing protein [Pseudomonadota bacterium]
MMMKKKPLAVLIGQVFGLVALAAAAGVAQAQQAAPERITVTGSRIPQLNLESNSPVTIIGAGDIKMDGITSTENLLNNLPQVFADQGGNVSNGSTGIATVNLRNLGPDRTLVLINGRRLPAGSPSQLATDLNQIPTPLIKRVEVLTGGASAIYGSDAVAGVVNFIMNDKFEGVQIDINRSGYNHEQGNGVASVVRGRNFPLPDDVGFDGKDIDANLLMGGNFAGGKGNATVSFNYKKQNQLLQAARDYSACSLGSNAAGFTCSGSSTSYPGRFFDLTSGASSTVTDANGNVRAFKSATDQYNFGPINAYLRPAERYGFNAFVNYEVAPKTKAYSEFGFHDDHTVAQIAPSGSFFGNNTYTISSNNPLLSPAWINTLFTSNGLGANSTNDIWLGRRNIEGGGR